MSQKRDRMGRELEEVRLASGGKLWPRAVVERARDLDNPLHGQFTWNDSEAGDKYRLEEARRLIRVYNYQVAEDPKTGARFYVSLQSDRKSGGGYRTIVEVHSDEEQWRELVGQVLGELRRLRVIHARLKELERVWSEVDAAQIRFDLAARPAGASVPERAAP